MQIYTLIYSERPINCTSKDSVIGPFVYKRRDDAVNQLFDYVKSRIISAVPDRFVEASDIFKINILDYTDDNDEPVTDRELERLFSELSVDQKQEINDWYFDYALDQETDAFYLLDNHDDSCYLDS